MRHGTLDIIHHDQAKTLPGLFRERIRRSPQAPAYRHFDNTTNTWRTTTWTEMAALTARWQTGLEGEDLQRGDRIALMLANSREWVVFEQAALGLGLVVVPLYAIDRADNTAYIVQDADVKILLIDGKEHWQQLKTVCPQLSGLKRILVLHPFDGIHEDARLKSVDDWLPAHGGDLRHHEGLPESLATIVYTSGTTGNPKGVMLNHRNILWNADSCLAHVTVYREDLFLSFLPLSHTLERTVGYYVPMAAGATVAYARSIPQLAEDLLTVRPTVMISVPRIFERVYNKLKEQLENRPAYARRLFEYAVATGLQRFQYLQGRASWRLSFLLWPLLDRLVANKILNRLGGRLRVTICGGAPLSSSIAQVFVGLGLPLLQGYGLTEASPVISANKLDDNDPASVGVPLRDVTARISESGELVIKSPGVCMGYWYKPEATAQLIDADGWLHTGDKARIENGHIYITGRLKEIIVLANGEKVPPADMEAAIVMDPLFEQVMVAGEGKPFLSAIVVLNLNRWETLTREQRLNPNAGSETDRQRAEQALLQRIAHQLHAFPGYAQIRRVALSPLPWTIDNGLLTPSLKLRRDIILQQHHAEVAKLYAGH